MYCFYINPSFQFPSSSGQNLAAWIHSFHLLVQYTRMEGGGVNCRQSARIPHPAFACDLAFSYIFKLVSGITPWAACTCRSAHLTHLHRKRREGGTVLFCLNSHDVNSATWPLAAIFFSWSGHLAFPTMQWRQCLNNWNTAVYSKTCQRLRHKYILVGFSRNLTKYWFREIKYFSYLNNDCF